VYSLDGLSASLPAANPAATSRGKRRPRPVKGETARRRCSCHFLIPPDWLTGIS